ncbi:RNA-binding protein [Phormidium sp. CLA17]|uniref:RNA recognition motif domain-containing protein n=1 Tax=Leptolyngbya sp. Cla-17 TaxID=2803751 RepID=UPI0014926677|nr:RNA-binding protein [Leptolyngbya sp. Cla-17]MBM0742119.1 RNA-binding protein [Leptolyngbya sp. Cla-17]
MSVRLYIGNLSEDLTRQELEAVFTEVADSISTKLITDRKTNKCRGFGFVTVKTDEEADAFIEKFNGHVLNDNPIKIEKALPRAKEKEDDLEPAVSTASVPAPSGARKGGVNKGSNAKARKGGTSSPDLESVQPDPRWAQDLEKLKQLLAAQTTNS